MRNANLKPYHHGNLRAVLIEAALALIQESGYQAFTLREVARRAGVSHSAPYRHFPDKESLLASVAEEGFHALSAASVAHMSGDSDVLQRLQRCGEAYLHFAASHPAHFRVMFGAALACEGRYPGLQRAGEAAFAVLLDAIEACRLARLLRDGDAQTLALTAWALVHGLAMLWLDGHLGAVDPTHLAARVLPLLHQGLLVRP